ncbi:MAG: hypothetical protein JNM44_14335 [Chitinophagaceae bacterium]|nr:hypothetical protein [Chitinophagaceae bacterium]
MKPYLLLVNLLLLISSSRAQPPVQSNCLAPSNIPIEAARYRTTVDVLNKHLSGILIFKPLEDSSWRVVFINEMGVTFFDFSFYPDRYIVHSILESMDKKAVKRSLAKDLGMLLRLGIYTSASRQQPEWTTTAQQAGKTAILKLQRKGKVAYQFDANCQRVTGIRNFGRKKTVVEITPYYSSGNNKADSVWIEHRNVQFSIRLKKMYAEE